jgi:hypothetical protein
MTATRAGLGCTATPRHRVTGARAQTAARKGRGVHGLQSAFYLTEFLFKFHKRAFNWSSLELLEEVMDVHHAPDVRDLLSDIVQSLSQSSLVPIMSGMYKYRFDSAFAAEVRYASRLSDFASESFNFTLDATFMLNLHYNAGSFHLVKGNGFQERAIIHFARALKLLEQALKSRQAPLPSRVHSLPAAQ